MLEIECSTHHWANYTPALQFQSLTLESSDFVRHALLKSVRPGPLIYSVFMQNQAEAESQGFMPTDLLYSYYPISVPFPLVGTKKGNVCSH